jgi:tripartite-type tricarboxylate transporter receptor subunit TctC
MRKSVATRAPRGAAHRREYVLPPPRQVRYRRDSAAKTPASEGKADMHNNAMPFRYMMMTAFMAAAALMPGTPATAQSVAEFYAGKQLSLLVGASAGGGYDHLARLTSKHLGKHIPGHPTVVVQNMPAAGSLAATNHIANTAPRDGTMIALVQRGMLLAKLTNPTGVRFEVSKLNWLASLASETGVVLAWNTAPHKTAKDLFDKELIVGGIVNVDPETTPKLLNALIGTKFKIITGYPGTREILLAMERGEVQGIGDISWSSIKRSRPTWLSEKKVRVLIQAALEKDPELKDVPSALDFVKNETDRKVMQLNLTQKTIARPIGAPPDLPVDRLAALRGAFAALVKDKEFLADAEKSKMDVDPIPGAAVDKVIALIAGTPPDIAARYTKVMGPTAK